jgi:signal transduction histidine kinase
MPKSASEALCFNLSQCIHATAQPLAVLRASLGNSHVDRMSVEELRELAANSAMEVERLCTLFSCLQQLVNTESTKPQLSETSILPLLAHVADGVNLLFKEDKILLRSIVSDDCQPVLIDKARTLQALSTILLIAHAVSRPQDTVELIASSSSSNAVRVVVQNLTSHVEAVNAETSLSMAFAETNIRSQQADFSWSLKPFSVQIELQGAPLAQYC